MMIENREPLFDKTQTGNAMKSLVEKFSGDLENIFIKKNGRLIRVTALPLNEYFDLVRKIPYRRDMKPVEVVARPAHIFKYKTLGMDCKKKSILMGSWLREKKIPFRFIASSRRPDRRIHHVFPQGFLKGKWENLDATYSHYRPYQVKEVTAAEVL